MVKNSTYETAPFFKEIYKKFMVIHDTVSYDVCSYKNLLCFIVLTLNQLIALIFSFASYLTSLLISFIPFLFATFKI